MCNLALPENLRSESAWRHHDNDRWYSWWYQKFMIRYGVFGPRDPHKWHKWREWPITLFAIRGPGTWRMEDDVDVIPIGNDKDRQMGLLFNFSKKGLYLSRCQKWSDWSIQIQWPFFVAIHVYIGQKPLFFYGGSHRDSDRVYWFPSAFCGRTWK